MWLGRFYSLLFHITDSFLRVETETMLCKYQLCSKYSLLAINSRENQLWWINKWQRLQLFANLLTEEVERSLPGTTDFPGI